MILDDAVSSIPLAAWHARRIAALQSLDPKANLDAVFATEFPGGFTSRFYPAEPQVPAMYIGGSTARMVLYLGGIPTSDAGLRFINGYDNAEGGAAFRVFNSWINYAATVVRQRYLDALFPNPEHLDFVGYSAGGGVATELLNRWNILGSTQKRKLITFGAPRSHNAQVRDRLAREPIARWMTAADPIPMIPPRLTEAPLVIAVTTAREVLRWGAFVHTHGGIAVAPNGATAPADVPPVANVSATNSLASWYFSAENDPNNPHAITTYIAYLDAAALRVANINEQNADAAGGEPLNVPNNKEINRERARVRAQIAEAGHQQNATSVVIPEVQLFKAVKLDKVWVVYLGDRLVITAPIEKRARHIARAGNDFLRSLPKQAVVDPIALAAQLENFLALASSPDSGFSPQMNTNLKR